MEMIKYGGDAFIGELHKLIQTIWHIEQMPKDWQRSIITLINKKKEDRQICDNYREIMLLNTTYKILLTLIKRKVNTEIRNSVDLRKADRQ